MINPKNNDENNNDVTIAGTDFFTDSESFLNELTDDELVQVRGGAGVQEQAASIYTIFRSTLSLFLCGNDGVRDNRNDTVNDTVNDRLNE